MKATLLLLIALCLAVSISARSNSLLKLVKKWDPEHEAKGTRKGFGIKCSALTCAKSNKECGTLDMGNDVHITGCHNYHEESCNITESGVGYSTGVCLSTLPVGQRCDFENDRCTVGTECRLTEFVAGGDNIYNCYNIQRTNDTAKPGEPCGAFINCQYSMGTPECINGVCKFLNNGEPCTDEGQCHSILSYCDFSATTSSGTCQPLSSLGAACNTSRNNQCQTDLICNPTSILNDQGQCIEKFSIKEGKPCKVIDACKDGYCENRLHQSHFSGVCKDYRKTSTIGEKCADYTGNTDCTPSNGEVCRCNLDGESKCTNFYYEREYAKRIAESEDCEEEVQNKCNSSPNDAEYTKCVYESCKKTACKLYKDAKKHLGAYTDDSESCMLVQMCDASGLFASLPLLAIVAVIVMLFQ